MFGAIAGLLAKPIVRTLAPGMIKGASSVLGNLIGKQKNTAPKPSKINLQMPDRANYAVDQSLYAMPDEADYAIDDASIASMNSGAIDSMMRQNALTQQNIKQVGAAGRMPAGSVLDSLMGANYNLGRGFASLNDDTMAKLKAESQWRFADAKQSAQARLAEATFNADARYADALQRAEMTEAGMTADYLRGKKEARQSNRNQWGNMFDDMGNMALLQRAGFFNSKSPQDLSKAELLELLQKAG